MDWKSTTWVKNDKGDYVNIGVWSNDRNLINRIHRLIKKELEQEGWKKELETKG